MKNSATKRLLSWLMSAVMVVGEFGGMPLAANAYEDTQVEEETEEVVLDDEAAIEDDAAFCDYEEEVAVAEDDTVVIEEAQNDPIPNAIAAPSFANGAFTWEPLAADSDIPSENELYDCEYGEELKYIAGRRYDFGVSADTNIDHIEWLGSTDLIFEPAGNGFPASVYGYVTIEQILVDMMVKDYYAAEPVFTKDEEYYFFVKKGDYVSIGCNNHTVTYPGLTANAGAAAVSEWYCYYDSYVKKIVNPDDSWYYMFYETSEGEPWPESCPGGWEEEDNYRLVMIDTDDIIGYIITPYFYKAGTDQDVILNKNGAQYAVAYMGEGGIPEKTAIDILADKNYRGTHGYNVQAVRRDGKISAPSAAIKMNPIDFWQMSPFTAALRDNEDAISFEAPAIAQSMGIEWVDDMMTPDKSDDEAHISMGYQLYLSKDGSVKDNERYIEINEGYDTVSRNGIYTTYIYKKHILFRMMTEMGEELSSGTYTVTISTEGGNGRIYNTNTFKLTYNKPEYSEDKEGVAYVESWIAAVKVKSDENGNPYYDEFDRDGYPDDDSYITGAGNAGYTINRDHIKIRMPEEEGVVGYCIESKESQMELFDTLNVSEFFVIYGESADEDFPSTADFYVIDKNILDVTVYMYFANGEVVVNNLRARHRFDYLEKMDMPLTFEEGMLSWTNIDGVIINRRDDGVYETVDNTGYQLFISSLDNPFKAQELNFNYMIRPDSLTHICVDMNELIVELVNNRKDYDLVDGEYVINVTGKKKSGNDYVDFCSAYEETFELYPGKKNRDAATPNAFYSLETMWVKNIPEEGGRSHWGDNKTDEEYTNYNGEDKGEYVQKKNLRVGLRSKDTDVAGYIIRTTNEKTFQIRPNELDKKTISATTGKDYDATIDALLVQTIMDNSVTEGDVSIEVAAVYPDGRISEWNRGRKKEEFDELVSFDLKMDITDGVLSWNQKYQRDAEGNLVYFDNGNNIVENPDDGNIRTSFGPNFYIAKDNNDGEWHPEMDIMQGIEFDPDNDRASIDMKYIYKWIAERKYIEGDSNLSLGGDYRIFVVEKPWYDETDLRAQYNATGYEIYNGYKLADSVVINLSTNATAEFAASSEERDKWIKENAEGWFLSEDEATVGYTKVTEYEFRFAADKNADIAGYIISVPTYDVYDDPKDLGNTVKYVYVPVDSEKYGRYDATKRVYVSGKDSGIKIAAVYYNGKTSKWISPAVYSKADDYETVTMGVTYDNGILSATALPNLDAYCHEDVGTGEQIVEAAIVFRGSDFEIRTRIRKTGSAYVMDKQCIPAWVALDPNLIFGTYEMNLVILPEGNAKGIASAESASFIYAPGGIAAPGEIVYVRDQGTTIHIGKPVPETVGYIVSHSGVSQACIADENNNITGNFGNNIRVSAVNMFGNKSNDIIADAGIERLADVPGFNHDICVKVYPKENKTARPSMSGARVNVKLFDSDEPVTIGIYELAEKTGGQIVVDEVDFNTVTTDSISVSVKLVGGRLTRGAANGEILLGTVPITVKDITIKSIDIIEGFSFGPTGYCVGQIPKLFAGTIKITYSDDSEQLIDCNNNALAINREGAFTEADLSNRDEAGKIDLGFRLNGDILCSYSEGVKGDPITVKVALDPIKTEEVDLYKNPDKVNYFVGDEADWSGGIIRISKNNGTIEYLDFYSAGVTVEGFNSSVESIPQMITVKYDGKQVTFPIDVRNLRVEAIEVIGTPKLTYYDGESFDPLNAKLRVYYENGTSRDIDFDDEFVVVNVDYNGQYITITYNGTMIRIPVSVKVSDILNICICDTAGRAWYCINESFDAGRYTLDIRYKDDSHEYIRLIDIFDDTEVENPVFDSTSAGEKEAEYKYQGKLFPISYTVIEVNSIAIADEDSLKTAYYQNEELELNDVEITVYKTAEETMPEKVPVTADMISGYDKNTAGVQTVTVSFGGKTTTFEVTVIAIEVTSIAITSQPAKTTFYMNEDIDPAGAKLTVKYNHGPDQIIDITAAMLSGYDKTKAGQQTITVTYGDKTATFVITVLAKVVTRIEIAAKPTKLVYDYNTDLDITGGKVKVVFNNGETETINMTADMISGYDKTKAGKQTITVTYAGKTATFDVTVNAKPEEQPETPVTPVTPETPDTPDDDYYEFDPTVQEEPVVGEGMKIFFDDASLVVEEDGNYHITYTGKAIKPLVRVTDNRVILTEGVDYTVKYAANKNAGTATVTVKGKGTYSANETLTFVIDRRSITEAEIGGLVTTNENKVKPIVVYGGKVLKNKKDYKFTVEEGTVEFEGIGNFEGTTSEVAEVVTSKEMKGLGIKVKFNEDMPKEFIYDGTAQTIDEYLIVTDGTGEETGEYSVSYSDNVNAGKVTVMIVGTGSHKGKVKKTFKIKPYKEATFEVSYGTEAEYKKSGAKPFIVVSANETFELLTQGRDYTVKYKDNNKGGATASFKLNFKGNYKGAKYTDRCTFLVKKPALDKSAENVSGNYALVGDMVYGKKAKYKPKAYIVIDGNLVVAKEYSLEYSENGKLEGPKDSLIVTASTKDKNYAGKVSISYNVVDGTGKTDVNKAKVVLTDSGKSKVYGGAGDKVTLTPGTDFTVKIGKTEITSAADITANFDIFYADNDAVGKGTVILKGKNNYVGVFAGTFKIKNAIIKKK